MNRIRQVREQHGLKPRTLARRLRVSETAYLAAESGDPSLSFLEKSAKAIGVPIRELVEEPAAGLARETAERGNYLLLMKSVRSLRSCVRDERPLRIVDQMEDLLLRAMPELASVDPWPVIGHRRGEEDGCPLAERAVPVPEGFDDEHLAEVNNLGSMDWA